MYSTSQIKCYMLSLLTIVDVTLHLISAVYMCVSVMRQFAMRTLNLNTVDQHRLSLHEINEYALLGPHQAISCYYDDNEVT